MSTNKGSPLPNEYWIENPNPGNATQEWKDWWKTISDGNATGCYQWYKKGRTISDNDCRNIKPNDGLSVVTYQQYLDSLITEQSPVYAVGDWFKVLDTANVRSWGNGHMAVGHTSQVSKNDIEYNISNGYILGDNKYGINYTPSDIVKIAAPAASTQVSTDDYRIEKIKGEKVVIHCSTQEEWDTIRAAIPYCRILSTHWEVYDEESCIEYCKNAGTYCDVTYYKNADYTIVPASRYIAHNSKEKEYKVGDWVYLHKWKSGSNYYKDQVPGSVSRIESLYPHGRKELIVVEDKRGQWYIEDIRPCTQQEIDQAQGKVQDGWKVGDKIPAEWLKNEQTYRSDGRVHMIGKRLGSTDRTIVKVREDEYAQLSDTITVWLSPDQYQSYKSYMETSKSTSEWKIGDEVSCMVANGNGLGPSSAIGTWYRCIIAKEDTPASGLMKESIANGKGIVVKALEGPNTERYYRVLNEHVKPIPGSQVPVGWKVGDKWRHVDGSCGKSIVRICGDKVDIDYGETGMNTVLIENVNKYVREGEWVINPLPTEKKTMDDWKGTRVRITEKLSDHYGKYATVKRGFGGEIVEKPRLFIVEIDDTLEEWNPYTPWASLGAQCEIVNESKQVNNQSITNQKPKTTNNGNTGNSSRSSTDNQSGRWDILLSDTEEPIISRSGSRTGTAGYCGGELPTAKRGCKAISKGSAFYKEEAY